jgi:uncharacterized repeat protein (TIGR03803 family)
MNRDRSSGKLGAILLVATVIVASSLGASATEKYKTLHRFTGKDGSSPLGSLVFDAAGNLYGTTMGGGAHDNGVVFQLTPGTNDTWTEKVLHSFNGKDGGGPLAGLIFDSAGNLYGTTFYGGVDGIADCYGGCGVVFELTPNADGGWKEKVIHRFTGADGNSPAGNL